MTTFHRNTYSKDSRIEFACFSFHAALLFISFTCLKPDAKNNTNFDAVLSKHANFDEEQFFKHT